VLCTIEIPALGLTNTELEQLIGCTTPEDASIWLKTFGLKN
jgi:hypothetical protein